MAWFAVLLLLTQAYWQTKAPPDWTDIELADFLAKSPWAGMATVRGKSSAAGVPAFLATAGPVQKAVAERDRRVSARQHLDPKALAEPVREEFVAWFHENQADHIIVAARVGDNKAFSSESEGRHLERDCGMALGHSRAKLSSYFPPTSEDPYLYLAFSRPEPVPNEGTVTFDLYLPGVSLPQRILQFKIKDLLVEAKPEL